jgi:hypothetical protein
MLATLFLSPIGRHSHLQPTLGHLNKLLNWIAATCEFQQEVGRLRAWRDFWSCCAPETTCDDITQALAFAEWFEQINSINVLHGVPYFGVHFTSTCLHNEVVT